MDAIGLFGKIKYAVKTWINRQLNKVSPSMAKSIKNTYITFILFLMIVGLFMGIRKGRTAAEIDLPPLAQNVNDVFEFDIKKERTGGDFLSITDSAILSEENALSSNKKIPFESQADISMEYNAGILDYKPEKTAPPSMMLEPELAEALPPIGRSESDVAPLARRQIGESSAQQDNLQSAIDGVSRDIRDAFSAEKSKPASESLSDGKGMLQSENNAVFPPASPAAQKQTPDKQPASKQTESSPKDMQPLKDFSDVMDGGK